MEDPDELRAQLLAAFQRHLGLSGPSDVAGFDRALGLDDKGWVPFDAPDGSERWQILSPVRMHPHGVHDLNRWVQRQFHAEELETAWGVSLGDKSIVAKDKVIQTTNQKRKAYNWVERAVEEHYIANGEVTLMSKVKNMLKGVFAGRPNLTFDYWPNQFSDGYAPLELAYALTVHKSQGSETSRSSSSSCRRTAGCSRASSSTPRSPVRVSSWSSSSRGTTPRCSSI